MRRITLALALVGAVAATGCGSGAPNGSTGSGSGKGIPGVEYVVTVQVNKGGSVQSGALVGGVFTPDGVVNCSQAASSTAQFQTCTAVFPWNAVVSFAALPSAGSLAASRFYFEGFAGDCAGTGFCTLSGADGNADKLVSVVFAQEPSAHPNWSGVAYGVSAHQIDYRCADCHGASLAGAGIAPACSKCHYDHGLPFQNFTLTVDGHFDPANEAWSDHGGWSQACQRCHTSKGYRDYVGELDGTANNLSGSFLSNKNVTAQTAVNPDPAAYEYGPLGCNVCHNDVTDPLEGLHPVAGIDLAKYFGVADANVAGLSQIKFPSHLVVTANKVQALCGQCHQARESSASVTSKLAASVASASRGQTYATLTSGVAGTVTTLVVKSTATAMPSAPTNVTGYTAIFNGNVSPALNGARAVVQSVGAWGGSAGNWTYTVTFATALPAAPAVSDSCVVYPTATGGSSTTLVDANRSWGSLAGKQLYVQTGAAGGKTFAITSNDATSITFFPADGAVAAGDFYQITHATAAEDTLTLGSTGNSTITFTNSHYLGAAATIWGAQAAGWYQYPGQTYNAADIHRANRCSQCHGVHKENSLGRFHVEEAACEACHGTGQTLTQMRLSTTWGDLDGDANATEGAEAEIVGLKASLYTALVDYSKLIDSTRWLCYGEGYPYMFIDTDQDGVCDPEEQVSSNGYNRFTPRSLKAAYNFKFGSAEPGKWAHNLVYTAQILGDAIDDLNAGITAKGGTPTMTHGTRP